MTVGLRAHIAVALVCFLAGLTLACFSLTVSWLQLVAMATVGTGLAVLLRMVGAMPEPGGGA